MALLLRLTRNGSGPQSIKDGFSGPQLSFASQEALGTEVGHGGEQKALRGEGRFSIFPCLSQLRLLKQNTVDRMAHQPQEFLTVLQAGNLRLGCHYSEVQVADS